MPLILLQPGTVARADDVNQNFYYILGLIGPTSDPDSFKPPKIKLGPQQNFVLSAEHNIEGNEYNFAFIAHNAEIVAVGEDYEYRRINTNSAPSAMELGDGYIYFRTTDRSAGELNVTSNWPVSLAIINTTTQNYLMIEKRYQIKNALTTSTAQSVMRNTTTFIDVPITVFEGKNFGTGTVTYTPHSLSNKIPDDANAVIVYFAFTAGSGSTRVFAYPHSKNRTYGGSWSARAGHRSSGAQQIIPLVNGKFVLDKEGSGTSAHLYIQGYLN